MKEQLAEIRQKSKIRTRWYQDLRTITKEGSTPYRILEIIKENPGCKRAGISRGLMFQYMRFNPQWITRNLTLLKSYGFITMDEDYRYWVNPDWKDYVNNKFFLSPGK